MSETIFKVTTPMGEKEYMAFQKHYFKKTLIPICAICSLVMIALGIYYSFDDLVVGIAVIVSGVIFPFVYVWAVNREVKKKKYKSNLVGDGVINVLRCSEDGFDETTLRAGNQIGFTALKYEDLQKVEQTKDYMFLYISKVQAFIVDKNAFEIGEKEGFLNFLKSKGVKVK